MPRRVGEGFDGGGGAVEGAVGDEGEGAGDGVRGAAPGGELRGGLGAAAEAGTEAGFLRGGGGGEKPAMLEFGRARGTDGPAVDAGGSDADEDQAVETGVPALQCAIAGVLGGEFHRRILSLAGGENSRFSDMVISRGGRAKSESQRAQRKEREHRECAEGMQVVDERPQEENNPMVDA